MSDMIIEVELSFLDNTSLAVSFRDDAYQGILMWSPESYILTQCVYLPQYLTIIALTIYIIGV